MDDRRRPRQIVGQLLGWGLSLVAIGFLVHWVTGLDQTVWSNFGKLRWPWLAASIVLFMPFFVLRAWAWELISRSAGYGQSRLVNWRMWALSELARYIPGNIWSFAARYQGARQGGVDRRRSLQSLVLEAAALVGGASLITAVTMPIGRWMLIATGLAIVTLLVVLFGPRLLQRWRPTAEATELPVISLYLRYVAAWAFYGAAAASLWFAWPDHSTMSFSQAFSANVAAWIVGYLSLVTPMGLGVREVTFVALVPAAVGAPLAGMLAILTRLVMAGTELLWVGVLTSLSRRSP